MNTTATTLKKHRRQTHHTQPLRKYKIYTDLGKIWFFSDLTTHNNEQICQLNNHGIGDDELRPKHRLEEITTKGFLLKTP